MSKFQKFLIGADIHGDMQDKEANRVFFEFAKIWKPEIRICNGDLFDFRPLRKGCSEDERRQSVREDLNAGKRWFNKFKPTHFTLGNHDFRMWDLAENGSGVAADYAQEGVSEIKAMAAAHKCRIYPYHNRDGVIRIGSLKVLHGFFCGVYAARQHALVYGSCLIGHVHRIDEHSIPGLERRVARCIGALCRLDLQYNSRMPNALAQANGFAYGLINRSTGRYVVFQAECIDGKWVLPSDFTEL